MESTPRTRTPSPWMTIHEASALIGVSPATLRRWCDQGEVKAFTTPGGHRRFSRSAVLGLVPAGRRQRPSLESLGESAGRMVDDVYHRSAPDVAAEAGWAEARPGETERMRDLGRRIATAVLAHLEAADPADAAAALATAEDLAAEHGRIACAHGLATGAAVNAFLGFRGVFLHELCDTARARDLDATETTQLLEGANAAMDRLLGAFIRAHELTMAERIHCGCVRTGAAPA
ncbi:MAG: helix-turn-helix domain-containing protein [Chloroflexi bacterium]|jgi:excisionase family DNA binding protein|nr:helix-turn-helix domain-containing protein [Chloroflexota bacterium]